MSGILDVPSFIPEPKGARVVRPLDEPPAVREGEKLDMNNKSASIRALLSQHSDGLTYDELSRYTGIARDRISAFVGALISQGDIKPFELNGRGRVFRYVGDPKRAGTRLPIEAEKKTSTPGAAPRASVPTPLPNPAPVASVKESAPAQVSVTAPPAPSREAAAPAAHPLLMGPPPEQAKREGKPVTAQIIWGSLTREVPEDSFNNILSIMCRAGQLTKVPGDGTAKWNPHFYEPGPKPVTDKRAVDRFSMIMGNMQHKRLLDARAAARAWRKERKAA